MILHITNDYSGSTVYMNLIRSIDLEGVSQIVYHPLRDNNRVGRNSIKFKSDESEIIYSPILDYTDRVFYRKKIQKILKDIETKIDLSKVTFVHAHTLYSDGGVAFLLNKKYNIPYVVAIRNTDINYFIKYLFWEREFGRKILEKAKANIFISKSYWKSLGSVIDLKVSPKSMVIPNGIDPFWLEHIKNGFKRKRPVTFKILYVGRFGRDKNVDKLYEAIKIVKQKGGNVELHLVGDIENFKKKQPILAANFVVYHGKITEKSKLLEIYEACNIFAMPSIRETFGLVYIEALSQGLPILFTKNDGIDGFYENIGEGVNKPVTINNIIEGINTLIEKYDDYFIDYDLIRKNHDWQIITQKYLQLYTSN